MLWALFLSLALDAFLDTHIFQLARFENLAAIKALDELGVFVAADDLYAWVLARLACTLWLRKRL